MNGWGVLRIRVSGETLIIGPRSVFGVAFGGQELGTSELASEDEVCRMLSAVLADPARLEELRRAWLLWEGDGPLINSHSDRTIVGRLARLTVNGPLLACIAPDTPVKPGPGTVSMRRTRYRRPATTPAHRPSGATPRTPKGSIESVAPKETATASTRSANSQESATSPTDTPAPQPQSSASPRPLSIQSMDVYQRIEEVLSRVPDHLGDEARRDFMVLVGPESLATTSAVLAVWAVSHAFGAGEILDATLMVAGYIAAGPAIWEAARRLREALTRILDATGDQDLDRAAALIADLLGSLGISVFVALVTHAAARAVASDVKATRGSVRRPPE